MTVTNGGTSTPYLLIKDVSVAGDFASPGNNCVGVSLPTGTSCEILLTFTPTQTGVRAGQISLTDIVSADSGTFVPNVVELTGTGTSGPVSFASSSLSFGTQAERVPGLPQSVVLTNTGNTDLIIHHIDSIDDDSIIEQDNCSPLPPATANPIHPGNSCTIQVAMSPIFSGSIQAGKVIIR